MVLDEDLVQLAGLVVHGRLRVEAGSEVELAAGGDDAAVPAVEGGTVVDELHGDVHHLVGLRLEGQRVVGGAGDGAGQGGDAADDVTVVDGQVLVALRGEVVANAVLAADEQAGEREALRQVDLLAPAVVELVLALLAELDGELQTADAVLGLLGQGHGLRLLGDGVAGLAVDVVDDAVPAALLVVLGRLNLVRGLDGRVAVVPQGGRIGVLREVALEVLAEGCGVILELLGSGVPQDAGSTVGQAEHGGEVLVLGIELHGCLAHGLAGSLDGGADGQRCGVVGVVHVNVGGREVEVAQCDGHLCRGAGAHADEVLVELCQLGVGGSLPAGSVGNAVQQGEHGLALGVLGDDVGGLVDALQADLDGTGSGEGVAVEVGAVQDAKVELVVHGGDGSVGGVVNGLGIEQEVARSHGHLLVGIDLVVQRAGHAQVADAAQVDDGRRLLRGGGGLLREGHQLDVVHAAELLHLAGGLRHVARHTGADDRAGNGDDELGLDAGVAVLVDDDVGIQHVIAVRGAGSEAQGACQQHCCCEGESFHLLHLLWF